MATLVWTAGAHNGNITTAENWSPVQAPAGGDVLLIEETTEAITTGDLSAISYTLRLGRGVRHKIFGAASPLLGATIADLTVDSPECPAFAFHPTALTKGTILRSGPLPDAVVFPDGTLTQLSIRGGNVRIGASAVLTLGNFGGVGSSLVTIDPGASVVTVRQSGGLTRCQAAAGSVYVDGGEWWQEGVAVGNTTLVEVRNAIWRLAKGTFTHTLLRALNGGVIDLSQARDPATVTNCESWYGGALLLINGSNTIVCTNPPKSYGGRIEYTGALNYQAAAAGGGMTD